MNNNNDFKELTFSVGYSSMWSTSFGTLTHLVLTFTLCLVISHPTKEKTEVQDVKWFIQVLY